MGFYQMAESQKLIVNFGRNVSFRPREIETPRTEDEVLEILKRHCGRKIRAIGRLHAWSEAPSGDDVIIDLRNLNEVRTERRDGGIWATIGSGCQIKRVLTELDRQAGATTPSVGLISEQALAGAISTGTHGSGKNSLSHYAAEFRIAMYDPETGEPVIRTISEGPELRAARCSLGCLGVIVSIGLWARPKYNVEEQFRCHSTLEGVLKEEAEHPLQQFFLIPWSWTFYGQHRREVADSRSWLASLYRLYFFLTFDIGMHLVLLLFTRWLPFRGGLKFFFRQVIPWTVVRKWKVIDNSSDMLIMENELFVHIETEVFVKRSQLPTALPFVIEMIRHFDGEAGALSPASQQRLRELGLWEEVVSGARTYTHHYPICVRRILPDDTLISMASSDDEDYYSISIVSVAKPSERDGFFRFSEILASTMATLFAARLHWGKYCPTDSKAVTNLYPHLHEFRSICNHADVHGRFRNNWVDRLIFGSTPE